jgi:hypothetical protein
MLKRGDSTGDSPTPNEDPDLSAKVTYGLMDPSPLSMLQFLASMLRSLGIAMMTEKEKIIFWLDSGAHFSVLPFSLVPSPMTKVIMWGKSG